MIADERLALIRAKVARANKHIQELDAALVAFFKTNPYVVQGKHDPDTGRPVYKMTKVDPVSVAVPVIAGDVLQNLRSALDYLAYQLVSVGTGSSGPFDYVYFPIAASAAKYESDKRGKLKGMRPEAVKAIDAIKPYGGAGGNETLWHLHQLNNIDKHRLLITAGSAFHSVDIGSHISALTRETIPGFPTFSLFVGSADPGPFPLKAGDTLPIGLSPDVDKEMQIRFHVAFCEPGVLEREPVLKTLQDMANLVDNLITGFRPLLS